MLLITAVFRFSLIPQWLTYALYTHWQGQRVTCLLRGREHHGHLSHHQGDALLQQPWRGGDQGPPLHGPPLPPSPLAPVSPGPAPPHPTPSPPPNVGTPPLNAPAPPPLPPPQDVLAQSRPPGNLGPLERLDTGNYQMLPPHSIHLQALSTSSQTSNTECLQVVWLGACACLRVKGRESLQIQRRLVHVVVSSCALRVLGEVSLLHDQSELHWTFFYQDSRKECCSLNWKRAWFNLDSQRACRFSLQEGLIQT